MDPTATAQGVFQRVLTTMAEMEFSSLVPSKEQETRFLDTTLSGLRPGAGLVGNASEEEALWVKDKNLPQHEVNSTEADCSLVEGQGQIDVEDLDDDETEGEGDEVIFEDGGLLQDYVETDTGPCHISTYLGPPWRNLIEALFQVEAMQSPSHMRIVPHDYQLKGAAQADWACRGPFRGLMVGHEMGVGKTLLAILAMWLCRDEAGMCLVVAPASLCAQWVTTIERAWELGHGMSAYHLEDSSMTASMLLAGGYDVIVTSYEFVEASCRHRLSYYNDIQAFVNDQQGKMRLPKRPTSALHSNIWGTLGLPWKRVVLDEAQRVNKRGKKRHDALKELNAKAFIILSGTLPHNKWHDFSGYVDFLQGHPFDTHQKFMRAFSNFDNNGQVDRPDMAKIKLLQTFLQAILIACPASVLNLPACRSGRLLVTLFPEERGLVNQLTCQYKDLAGKLSRSEGIDGGDSPAAAALSLAIMAQMASLHPMMYEEASKKEAKFKDWSEEFVEDKEDLGGEGRDEWLLLVRQRENLCTEGARIARLLNLYQTLRSNFPTEKIVIFSQYLKFLDIVEEALRRTFNVDAVRFDGSVRVSKRTDVEEAFKSANPDIPLLITAGAGGVGLNITYASIVVQTEPWWNRNVERQGIARVWRQLQTNEVKYIRIEGGLMDAEIVRAQRKKVQVNLELMEPLLRRHDEPPAIIKLATFPQFPIMEWE